MDRFQIRHIEKILLVAVFTTFMGQIYIKPFQTEFRLTFAVVVLNILLLTFDDIEPFWTINLVGVMMLLVRTVVHVYTYDVAVYDALSLYYPVIFFYLFYAFFFMVLEVRKTDKNPLLLFMSIWICDSIPNIIEMAVRQDWLHIDLEIAIYTIILIGLIRSFFTVLMIYLSQFYFSLWRERQNHQKFVEKIVMTSGLKTELFFLKKSRNDIEEAVRATYRIYENLDNIHDKEALLSVTKDIHEIKKDYTRVLAGMERHMETAPQYDMTFKEMLAIVIDTNKKFAQSQKKPIEFHTRLMHDFKSPRYFALISILNNLIVNAIDAIEEKGRINVLQYIKHDTLYLEVQDTGGGISTEDIAMIYNPGFSTKFDIESGVMSSGVGLTHVLQLVTELFGGHITVDSKPNDLTRFLLKMPMINILQSEVEDEL